MDHHKSTVRKNSAFLYVNIERSLASSIVHAAGCVLFLSDCTGRKSNTVYVNNGMFAKSYKLKKLQQREFV